MVTAVVAYFANLVFVYSWVVIFFAPFAGCFYWQHRAAIREKKPHFNQFMELFFQSRSSNWLVFTWAVGEALIWFIIPEFLLFLVIFMRIKRRRELLAYDISGTAVGTIIGLIVPIPHYLLTSIPYIFPGMIAKVQDWYQHMGVWALVNQPFSGVPYKVFVAEVHYYAIPVVLFFVLSIIVRLVRYALLYGILSATYPALHKLVQKHYAILFSLGIAVFTLMLMKVSALYG